jgi:CRP-like cAMP-binding protein
MSETMTPPTIAERLRASAFLQGFPDAYFWRLSRAMTPRHFAAGAVLFAEGAPRELFAIVDVGTVAIE